MISCPCGGSSYSSCCEPYHLGADYPDTAEKLMCSRYSAFAKGVLNYLIETHHPAYFNPTDIHSLGKTFKDCSWKSLEIIKTDKGGKSDNTGTVLFQAVYTENGKEYTMEENSFFSRAAGKWVYQAAL